MISFQQAEKWCEEELAAAVAWHRAVSPKLTEEQLEAFSIGFKRGYGKALQAAKLHGMKAAA